MIPLALRITRFRSFRETQTFVFPTKPGLYFLCGENQAEPRLEANGAGKSTIWEALCWVLYGKTSRGLQGIEVANWESPAKVSVEFDYQIDDQVWTVARTWGPISWRLTSPGMPGYDLAKKDESNPLQAHLGLQFDSFLHSIFMAQFEPTFLDLKPPQKAALFSQVMDHDKWLDYSVKASTLAGAEDRKVRELETEVANTEGQLQMASATDYTEQIQRWEKDRAQKLNDKEREFDRYLCQQKELDAKARKGDAETVKLTVTIDAQSADLNRKLAQRDTLEKEQDKLIEEATILFGQLKSFREQQEFFSHHKHCDACLQPIPDAFAREYDKSNRGRVKKIEEAMAVINRAIDSLAETLEGLDRDIKALEEGLDLTRGQRRRIQTEADQLSREADSLDTLMDRIEEEVARLQKEANPHESQRQTHNEMLESLRKRLADQLAKLGERQHYQRCLQYWVKGFKELRLYLISESLQQLELEVNACLTQLGLVDWELRFDVDRENQSGKVQKGFAVKVISPGNKEAVPWEVWSGGESQRLRLATEQGLANLIRSSTGCNLPLEVWDEPTQGMSGQGVSDLLEALSDRARDTGRTIWIVDHRSLGYGAFEEVVTVIKGEKGSLLQVTKKCSTP